MADSWRLKVDRAQKHLEHLEDEIRRYARRHPYTAVRAVQPKGQQNIWRYCLKITEQPHPTIAVIAGDVVHNARSALDHIVVALAPSAKERKTASFPIELEDIWAKDAFGALVVADDDRRARFERAIRGIPAEAKTRIESMQPYAVADRRELHPLGILSRLENADKHRNLVTLASGVENTRAVITARGGTLVQPGGLGFREDGAEIAKFGDNLSPPLTEAEVNVKVRGTPRVTLKVGGVDRQFALPEALQIVVDTVTDTLDLLEPSLA